MRDREDKENNRLRVVELTRELEITRALLEEKNLVHVRLVTEMVRN